MADIPTNKLQIDCAFDLQFCYRTPAMTSFGVPELSSNDALQCASSDHFAGTLHSCYDLKRCRCSKQLVTVGASNLAAEVRQLYLNNQPTQVDSHSCVSLTDSQQNTLSLAFNKTYSISNGSILFKR